MAERESDVLWSSGGRHGEARLARPLLASLILLGSGLLSAAPAYADGPVQSWPSVFISAPLGGKWSGSADILGRIARDPTRASQLRSRVMIGRTIGRRVTLWAGYAHTDTYLGSRHSGSEEQLVEQVNWAVGQVGPVKLGARTRLEERFIAGNDRTAWRLREQVRAAVPIGDGTLSGVAYAEPFVALNRTKATTEPFEQLRVFAGVSLRLAPQVEVETGFLRQHLHRASGDVDNDVVPVAFSFRF